MVIDKEIFFDPTAGFFGSNSNYDKTRRWGIEMDNKLDLLKLVDVGFLDKFELFSNYTYQKPQFSEGANDGRDVPMVPRYQAASGVSVGFFKHVNFSLQGKYTGARFVINDTLNEKQTAKPYYVLDAKLAYKRDLFEAYVALNNILNEQYSPYVIKKSAALNDYYPAPETNFTVGVDLKF
jgi:iron complex outermembrane receptor protein